MSTAWVNGVGPAAVPNHTPWDFAKFSHREVAQLAARLVAKSGNDPDYLLDAGKVFATVPGSAGDDLKATTAAVLCAAWVLALEGAAKLQASTSSG